ncbi:hypothetical protein AKJ09_06366 [Labilithrix luteola]|uniref:Uncharacterized protein n=1 Tax=Labilithrix luteola TaxID=1391654 RepID=A0A0K1Q1U2_9BACT|nr:hypothetical protein AKJ09_06366 [Labilithrix luteola]
MWKSTSTRLEISGVVIGNAPSRYTVDLADMTPAQLSAAQGLRTIAGTINGPGWADGPAWQVNVTDQDGSAASFRVTQDNLPSDIEKQQASTLPTIDYTTLTPFLGTFECMKQYDFVFEPRTTGAPIDTTGAYATVHGTLTTDKGCTNYVSTTSACGDGLIKFPLTQSGTYEIFVSNSTEPFTLRAYSEDGATLVAESSAGTGTSPFTFSHAFDAGNYLLVLSKTVASGCPSDRVYAQNELYVRLVP